MSELKIDDATPDTDVQGNELIPVSDNGTAKSVKVEDIKDFTLEKAAALAEASAVTLGKDGVYIRQGGELKPVPAETFANAVIAAALGKAAASDLSGSESVVVKSGGAAKTATLADIAAYVKTVIVGLAASFDIDGLAATTAAAALKVPVSETDASGNASNKSLTLSDIKKFIAPTDSLTLCPTTASGDVILAIDSDKKWKGLPNTLFTDKSITTPTANSVTAGQLVKFADKTGSAFAGGPSVVAKVRTSNSASASDVPTEAAVRSAIDAGTPDATTEGNIPTWSATQKKLQDGWPVKNAVFASSVAADDDDNAIPTTHAVGQFVTNYGVRFRQVSTSPSATDGLYPGEAVFESDSDGNAIFYVNVGTRTAPKFAVFKYSTGSS